MIAVSPRVQSLLEQLTLDEKVSLLAGASSWYTVPVERLGIPAIKVTDGPNGARGDVFEARTTAAAFPVGISLAATWNPDLVGQVGAALAAEARSKGAVVLLGPTVNIHRSTLNGRNFECYSEDPFLTARLAVAYIRGLQGEGVGASVKHFAGNNSEFERNSISSEIGERALREIYLPAFEAAVHEAGTWTVMAAYNKLNGAFCTENPDLLTRILKEEWAWDGVVMSDWYATHSTAAAANAGLDLEMPGPTQWRGAKLVQAVRDGLVAETAVDDEAARMLHLIERSGAFEHPEIPEQQAIDRPEHRALIRRAGAEGCVLLQNRDGLLPLDPAALQRVAVIGPNAKAARIMGGGSSHVSAHYAVTPFEGITAQLGPVVKVAYEVGCSNDRFTPLLAMDQVAPAPGAPTGALAATYYNSLDLSGDPVWQTSLRGSQQTWLEGVIGPGVDPGAFSLRVGGVFTPRESGSYTFGLTSAGSSRLLIDGAAAVDLWNDQPPGESFFGSGAAEQLVARDLEAGRPVTLTVEYSKQGTGMIAGFRLGVTPTVPGDSIARATRLAADSDVALVFVGSSGDWESEGADRTSMDLVGEQAALIRAVAAANPRTVVVLQTGSPITMPWLDGPAAVLQAWFCGQECGNAIADVLFARVDASGRLSQTFPVRLEDNPAYLNYPGENGRVIYGEGIFVGYRFYEKRKIGPLFPFGFGLSYTTFAYANLRLDRQVVAPDDLVAAPLDVTVEVTNTGARSGMDVVQLYVRDPHSTLVRPEKELKGFAKVALQPGETQTVHLPIDRRALAFYDDAVRRWVAEAGTFEVLVGRSSADILLTVRFDLTATARFDGPGTGNMGLTLDTPIGEILSHAAGREIFERHLPGFAKSARRGRPGRFTLRQMATFAPSTFTEEVLAALAADLATAG